MREIRNIATRYALPLMSGTLLGILFYFPQLWFLVFIALTPWFIFIERQKSNFRTIAIGTVLMILTMTAFGAATLWPSDLFFEWLGLKREFKIVAVIFLVAFTFLMTLPHILILLGGVRFGFSFIPSLWVLAEFGRALISGGFTYGHLGYRVVDFLPLAITSRLWGVYGLSFFIVLTNQLLSKILMKRFLRDFYIGMLVMAIVLIGGYLWSRSEFKGSHQEPELKAAVIQAGIEGTGRSLEPGRILPPSYDSLVRRIKKGTDIIILPNTVGEYVSASSTLLEAEIYFSNLLQELDGKVIVSGHRLLSQAESQKWYNAMIAWEKDGSYAIYRKRVLFPFGEYFPLFDKIFEAFLPETRYIAAPQEKGVIETKAGILGILICQEIDLSNLARESIKSGAQILVSGGSEWQFGKYVHQEQLRIARLRALEFNRFFLRSMKAGTSAIIDSLGRPIAVLPQNERYGALEAQVRLLDTKTPYAKFGEFMPLVLILISLMVWKTIT
jgi:apolipoprotein N-acyltransferase